MQDLKIGQVVFSKAGRDKGDAFVVMDVTGDYAYLANGKSRRIDQPKKKKCKHIQPTHWISQEVAQAIQSYIKLTNADIAKEIQAFLEKNTEKEE